jgi:hypothetical protein
MKAEERKELETNALRAWATRWKERLRGRALYGVVGTLILVTLAVVIFLYWRSAKRAADSARIMDYVSADSEKKLDDIIKSDAHRGKPTAAWAKLQKARLALYRDGLEKIGTANANDRAAAYARIEEGRKLYQEVVNDLKDSPSLQQECWIACARAEEALLGVPAKESGGDYRGNFDQMLDDYGKAAAIMPDGEASKGYAAEAEKKKVNREAIVRFYRELYQKTYTVSGETSGKGGDLFKADDLFKKK